MSSSLYAIAFSRVNTEEDEWRSYRPLNEYEKFVIFLKRKWRGASEGKKIFQARKLHNVEQRLGKDWAGSA
jgi:hypothetical protein